MQLTEVRNGEIQTSFSHVLLLRDRRLGLPYERMELQLVDRGRKKFCRSSLS
ncbi:Hypothetical predicted protein [Podarcis lilfordi]|uniref:Uncharacterized protein n=1 Tax=Podarcis lilfordi TaxID=74358 RepID=A0AA35PH12_9SAUR|nr:Hypothetical predicted protein [Podarcis lilfordi]